MESEFTALLEPAALRTQDTLKATGLFLTKIYSAFSGLLMVN